MNLKQIVGDVVGYSILVVAFLGLVRISPGYEHNQVYKQAGIIADSNRDGRTSKEEWSEVYRELGAKESRWAGFDLSTKQLRRYIANHS